MDDKKFQAMHTALTNSIKRFPDCKIANCDCNSRNGEWKKGCMCACHFYKMDELYGKDKWALSDMGKESKEDYQIDSELIKVKLKNKINQLRNTEFFLGQEIARLIKNCPHEINEIKEPEGHDSARCWICGKKFGWYCKNSPTKYCKYDKDPDCCIYCSQPEERK